jgi:hypothetical protein
VKLGVKLGQKQRRRWEHPLLGVVCIHHALTTALDQDIARIMEIDTCFLKSRILKTPKALVDCAGLSSFHIAKL